jgi:hypothetical protein
VRSTEARHRHYPSQSLFCDSEAQTLPSPLLFEAESAEDIQLFHNTFEIECEKGERRAQPSILPTVILVKYNVGVLIREKEAAEGGFCTLSRQHCPIDPEILDSVEACASSSDV